MEQEGAAKEHPLAARRSVAEQEEQVGALARRLLCSTLAWVFEPVAGPWAGDFAWEPTRSFDASAGWLTKAPGRNMGWASALLLLAKQAASAC